ncbi:MAG: C2 domain-containing protein [Kofleriaceae bacterium]
MESLVVKTTAPDGSNWDDLGGAPDPFVMVELNGATVLTTNEVQDTYTPTFGSSASVAVPAGARLRFEAFDSDVFGDQGIITCELNPLSAAVLRNRRASCVGDAATGTNGTVLDLRFESL